MKKLLFAIFALLVMGGSAQAAYFIDDFRSFDPLAVFTGADGSMTYNAGTPSEFTFYEKEIFPDGWSLFRFAAPDVKTVSEAGLSTWGGTRFTEVDFKGFGGVSNNVVLGNNAGGYYISNGGSGAWKSFSMTYSSGASDFSDATKLSMTFDPDHVGFGKATVLSVTLSDSDSSFTSTRQWTSYANPAQTTVDYLFADFAGIDKNDIQEISWFYETDYANDVIFTSFTTDAPPVPLPAAVWLLGSGLLGLYGIRRRHRK